MQCTFLGLDGVLPLGEVDGALALALGGAGSLVLGETTAQLTGELGAEVEGQVLLVLVEQTQLSALVGVDNGQNAGDGLADIVAASEMLVSVLYGLNVCMCGLDYGEYIFEGWRFASPRVANEFMCICVVSDLFCARKSWRFCLCVGVVEFFFWSWFPPIAHSHNSRSPRVSRSSPPPFKIECIGMGIHRNRIRTCA